jgi:hypothetical protein
VTDVFDNGTARLHTQFPNLDRITLCARAMNHALDPDYDYDYDFDPCVPEERLAANMLRHANTNYDDYRSADRHRAACEAIAQRYPWLAEECQRQNVRCGELLPGNQESTYI